MVLEKKRERVKYDSITVLPARGTYSFFDDKSERDQESSQTD